ncbi:MAG: lamin tail domain-containing protein [Flavobacteriales bacterium]
MKTLFISLMAMLSAVAFGQLNEDFSSSNFSKWKGDTNEFVININQQLQSNATGAGTSWISAPYHLQNDYSIQLWLNMTFSPSTTNYVKFYLFADHAQSDSIQNGIYCKVGKSGTTDSYDFYLQQAGKKDSLLISAPPGWAGASNNKASLKILPFSNNWIVSIDPLGGENFETLDTIQQYFSGNGYFGIYCKYSASNAKKFFFDEIIIDKYLPDTFVAKYGDVLITEIMCDPDPAIALPNQEYLELYNNSSSVINLKSWTISVNGSTYTFPKILLQPHEYYVLNSALTLLNEGAEIILKSNKDEVIYSINYSSKWYQDPFKEEGGWSLEMKDISHYCLGKENWSASNSLLGGSPGKVNSIAQTITDEIAPEVQYFYPSENEVFLHFSEPVYYASSSPFYKNYPDDELKFSLNDTLQKGEIYSLQVAVKDCALNELNSVVKIALRDSAQQSDIVINEILFDPLNDGADFVELYNRSNRVIDLSQLRFSSRNGKGFLNAADEISSHPLFLFPNEYAVFTIDKSNILQNYPTHDEKRIFEISALPSLNNDAGNIVLLWPNGIIVDEFQYTEKMHDILLDEVDGISLERINPNSTLWHSAAQDIGWATPGLPNSQYLQDVASTNDFQLQDKVLTPNQDGYKDFALIHYQLDKAGYKSTINIYDASGVLVKILVSDFFLSTEGEFQWNGTDENGNLLPAGIYVLFAEYFHEDGTVKHWKESVAVER